VTTTGSGGSAPGARLTRIETIRTAIQPNVTIVAVEDADGVVGLGETFYGASSVEAYIHDVAAPLLAESALSSPAEVARVLSGYVGYVGSGSEVRGNSAIDIALWDLGARRAGLPLREYLGGHTGAPALRSMRTYNTCAGNRYVNAQSRQASSNWGIDQREPGDRYEDLWAFLHEPGRLALDLLAEGYPGMKVWPFDLAAELSGGSDTADLSFGLGVLDEIRAAVGDRLELYVELHSLWTPRGAERLLAELARFSPAWVEDPIRADRSAALSQLRADSDVRIAVGESLGAGVDAYRRLFDARAVDVAIIDLGWGGGITQGLEVSALAAGYGIPVAPHDCTGPISLATAAHFVTAIPNGHVQEVSRAFYHGWYRRIADGLPQIEGGIITPGADAGHGLTLRADFLSDPGTTRRVTVF
jgi:galactonate dehydratase